MSKKRVFEGKILSENMSEDWEYLLETSPAFNYFTIGEITLVCPIPNGNGSLVIRENLPFYPRKIPWKPSIHSLKPIA
ncbi:hypothetical protein [Candidatus Enterococcus ferrettii]|uniref:Uncharacterized protein n=1 Tax=Candidatus Enterococcus ferrettii TaxID=2815324 RepID=A0ABV0ENS0_9ENTE